MADFQILRYLKKWRFLILLVAILGSAAVLLYGQSKQSYSASVVIAYTNAQAEYGKNPDGSKINVNEISSAAIIEKVKAQLRLTDDVEKIRSRVTVAPVLTLEETERKESAALDHDETFVFYPTRFKVTYQEDKNGSLSSARSVLDAVITNYFDFYSEKYRVADKPSVTSNVSIAHYDYIECVDIMESNINSVVAFAAGQSDGFVSTETGYSFANFKTELEFIRDNDLYELREYVLDNRLTVNRNLLINHKNNTLARLEMDQKNDSIHLSETKKVLDQFADKTVEQIDGLDITDDDTLGQDTLEERENSILDGVQNPYYSVINGRTQTTYDKFLAEYAALQARCIDYKYQIEYNNKIVDIYSHGTIHEGTQGKLAESAIAQIDSIGTEFNTLYDLLSKSVDEFNQVKGAENLKILNSIAVSSSINIKLYVLLAAIISLILGCGLAVVFGRAGDFIEYWFYYDPVAKMPNKQRCAAMTSYYEKKDLGDDFTCCIVELPASVQESGLSFIEGESEHIADFGNCIRQAFSSADFIGYVSDGLFLIFEENCPATATALRAESLRKYAKEMIGIESPEVYSIGMATSTEEDVYDVRELLQIAKEKTSLVRFSSADTSADNADELTADTAK